MTIGYVSTEYGKRDAKAVTSDLDLWRKLYPKIQGAFFDEMNYEDTAAAVERQQKYRRAATERGMWPTVANPGTADSGAFLCRGCRGCHRGA